MKVVKVNNVEDILSLGDDVGKIEIAADAVIRYIYFHKDSKESQINIDELRNVYAKSVKKSYARKRYMDDIMMNSGDIRKVCYG